MEANPNEKANIRVPVHTYRRNSYIPILYYYNESYGHGSGSAKKNGSGSGASSSNSRNSVQYWLRQN